MARILIFLGRRLAVMAGLLIVISFLLFSLLYIAPGSVLGVLLGGRPSTPLLISELQREYHLNDPFFAQYWLWAKNVLHLNFGVSIVTHEPVSTLIGQSFPVTLFLGVYAFLIAMLFGVPLGLLCARRRGTRVDRIIVGSTVFGVSIPAFVSGLLLLYVFTDAVHLFPSYGAGQGFIDRLYHLTLPAIALSLTELAFVVKISRAALLGVLEQDYITFAQARGVPRARLLFLYTLRNALVPIVTAAGLLLGFLLAGAVLVENVFAVPGLGSLLVSSVLAKDVPVVQAVALLAAVVLMGGNLAADLSFLVIDPRLSRGLGVRGG